MRDQIHIEVVSTPAQWQAAREHAEQHGFILQENLKPTRIIRRGSQIIGFSQVFNAPVHVTHWKTDASKRDVLEGLSHLRTMQEGISPDGTTCCFLHDKDSPFSEPLMEHLGFRNSGLRLFLSELPT